MTIFLWASFELIEAQLFYLLHGTHLVALNLNQLTRVMEHQSWVRKIRSFLVDLVRLRPASVLRLSLDCRTACKPNREKNMGLSVISKN